MFRNALCTPRSGEGTNCQHHSPSAALDITMLESPHNLPKSCKVRGTWDQWDVTQHRETPQHRTRGHLASEAPTHHSKSGKDQEHQHSPWPRSLISRGSPGHLKPGA